MLAFEVHLNGKKVCTAGIGEPGVISSIITWVLGDGKGRPSEQEQVGVRVGGLISRTEQHVTWFNRPLRRGDKISIRIVEVDDADTPKKQPRESLAQRRRQQQAYLRRMAKELGWKIERR